MRTRRPLEAALGYYRALRPWLPAGQRKRVRVPAAAFAGTHDLISVSAYQRARSRYADRYEVVKMPGGHFMHREHPDLFIENLLRVLGRSRWMWRGRASLPASRRAAAGVATDF